jgi:hypothetical protein
MSDPEAPSQAGRRPPRPRAADYDLPEHVRCPFCETEETELHSAFGPQLSVASYWCLRCRTAFDWLKWRAR